MTTLDYRQAARRVRRSVRTIKRWRRAGLTMSVASDGRRLVEESELLAWWRDRLGADPVHQIRMQRLASQQNERGQRHTSEELVEC